MLDIKFKSNLESLDLGNASINFQANNLLFSSKINQEYISYNFTVPATPNNLRNLNTPQIIDSNDNFEDVDIIIYSNQSNGIEGVLTIEDADNYSIKLSLIATNFNNEFLDSLLSEMSFGDVITMGADTSEVEDYVLDACSKSYPDTSHVFPMIFNSDFYGGSNPEFWNVINNALGTSSLSLAANIIDGSTTKNRNTLVPYFFLVWIFKQIFELNGIRLTGQFLENEEVQKILVHNNYSLDAINITSKYVNALKNSDWYVSVGNYICNNDSTPPYEDADGIYNTTTGEISLTTEGSLKIKVYNLKIKATYHIDTYYRCIVRLKVNGTTVEEQSLEISKAWISTFNLEFNTIVTNANVVGGHKAVLEFTVLKYSGASVVAHSATVYTGSTMEVFNDTNDDLNIYTTEINPNNHLPNQTARDFVNSFVKMFKLIPFYDPSTSTLTLDFFNDIIQQTTYDDITDKISSNKVILNKNSGYTVQYDLSQDSYFSVEVINTSRFTFIGEMSSLYILPTATSVNMLTYVKSVNAWYVTKDVSGVITWVRIKEQSVDPFITGDGTNEYKLAYNPFYMDEYDVENVVGVYRTCLIPHILEKGNTSLYDVGVNDPALKLLIWHGIVDITGGAGPRLYAFASSYNYNQTGTSISELSMKLSEDDESIYTIYLKKYFDFVLSSKLVKQSYLPTFKSIFNYPFTKKQLVFNQRFLTNNLKFKVSKKGVESITAENYKV